MTPFLLILAMFAQFHDIVGILPGVLSPEPYVKKYCEDDAFISSNPIDGKVFLAPAIKADRFTFDWYQTRAYCANHCAEMITVKSVEQHKLLNEFFTHLQYSNVWMGAQIVNRTDYTQFSNGENATSYYPKTPGEYDESIPLSCATLYQLSTMYFWGYYCYGLQSVGCQRQADWVPCE